MTTAVLDVYNQLTKQNCDKVSDFILFPFYKYKKTPYIKKLSSDDEKLFKHLKGSLSENFDSEKTIHKNKSEKYGV